MWLRQAGLWHVFLAALLVCATAVLRRCPAAPGSSPLASPAADPDPPVPHIHIGVVAAGAKYAEMFAAGVRSVLFHRRRRSRIEWHVFADRSAAAWLRANLTLLAPGALPPCATVSVRDVGPLIAQARAFLAENNLTVQHYVGVQGLALAFLHDHVPPHVDRLVVLGTDIFYVDDVARHWDLFAMFDRGTTLRDQEPPDGPLAEFFSEPLMPAPAPPANRTTVLAATRWYPPLPRTFRWRATWPDAVVMGGRLVDVAGARRINLTARYAAAASFYRSRFGVDKLTAADQTLANMFALTHPDYFSLLPCWTNVHTVHVMSKGGVHWNRTGWCRGEAPVNVHVSPSRQVADPDSRYSAMFRWYASLRDGWLAFCPGESGAGDGPANVDEYFAEGARIWGSFREYNGHD
ncbi:hypothetical protein DFJ74DRAFT_272741 [Hyaloraphidium curvatum]|nr:hypothetical protein DFJ74DRAFT_272741 [Hyaloraphidium curvatum]